MKKCKYIVATLLVCLSFLIFVPKTSVAYAAGENVEIEVYGNSTKKIKADRAEVYFCIENMAKTQEEAKNITLDAYKKLNNELISRFNSTLEINNFYIRANIDFDDNQTVLGYTAILNCCVEVIDLSNFMSFVDIAVQNNVRLNYMNYYSSKAQEEYQKALIEAKNNAIEKAKNLVSSEVKVLEIEETSQFYSPREYQSLKQVASDFDFNAEIEVSATIQLKCETI